jgi:glycosyltransferase involved in cell wall biosynthesis
MSRDESTALEEIRVLIVHDWMVAWAGSERCVEQMLEVFPQADLVVGVMAPDMRAHNSVTRRARETWMAQLPGARTHHRWFLPLEAAAFATLDTSAYDLVISSSHAFSKTVCVTGSTRHVCYCHSPPRYLWDLYEKHRRTATLAERAALVAGVRPLRWWDRRMASRVDHFMANSHYIADRIRRCYGRDATVVNPPVSPKPASGPRLRRPILLTLGRLVRYKRVDLAVRAAEVLGMRLVVAGDGPERARLERLAGPHTTFLGTVSEQRAGELLEECSLFLFSAEEDFGIAPIEANAHGAPVVAYGAGGVVETLVEGETAEFFAHQTVPALTEAIRRATDRSWDEERIRDNARRFAPAEFRRAFRRTVASILKSGR